MRRGEAGSSDVERCRELLTFDRRILDAPAGPDLLVDGERLFPVASGPSEARGCFPVRLVGFDEAGRGAWAGPVAVACVHLPSSLSERILFEFLTGVDDSKRLSPRRRAELRERIIGCGRWAVGFATAREIDRVGIVVSCRRAAARAYRRLGVDAEITLFDRGLTLDASSTAVPRCSVQITHGDSRSLHVAAASIVAKTARDKRMERLDRACPGYGLAQHKGYGTQAHRRAILQLGVSRLHRGTFLRGLRRAESQFC